MSNLMDQVLEATDAFDVDGTKVGKVVQFDKVLGYFGVSLRKGAGSADAAVRTTPRSHMATLSS